jgi:hypothetical protein
MYGFEKMIPLIADGHWYGLYHRWEDTTGQQWVAYSDPDGTSIIETVEEWCTRMAAIREDDGQDA